MKLVKGLESERVEQWFGTDRAKRFVASRVSGSSRQVVARECDEEVD